jgi:hypothetical protein
MTKKKVPAPAVFLECQINMTKKNQHDNSLFVISVCFLEVGKRFDIITMLTLLIKLRRNLLLFLEDAAR